MGNKTNLGDFYTSNNEIGANVSMIFGNSSVNVSINSSSIVLSPNTSLSANGTIGSSGQVLTSNGTTVYWAAAAAGVNTSAQYVWTNTHTFNANVTFGNSTVNATAYTNSSGVYYTGTAFTANNANNLNGKAEAALNVNSAVTVTTNTSTNTFTIGTATYFVSNGNVGIGTNAPGYLLQVNGSFAATTKSFVIDHPTKEGMKLRYGSLEGPENGVYIRGKCYGYAILLPDYWIGLVDERSITVHLTPYGISQDLFVAGIYNNVISINAKDGSTPDCFYHVYAERKDVEKLIVEF